MKRPTRKRMVDVMKDLVLELRSFSEDAKCDHSVGICWCGYWRGIEQAEEIIQAFEKEARCQSTKE